MLYFIAAIILISVNVLLFALSKRLKRRRQATRPVEHASEAEPTPARASRAQNRRRKVMTLNINGTPTLRVLRPDERRPDHIPHHLAWFYRVDTRAAGPYTLEEMVDYMNSGRISERTLVWSENLLEDWTPVRDVDLLHAMRNAASQPIDIAAEAFG